LLGLLGLTSFAAAAVPATDITLQAVQNANLPPITTISAYSQTEANALLPNKQMPIFTPYNNRDDAWWDNLVSEHLQARLPVIMLSACGAPGTDLTFNPANTSGPGDMNPLRLQSYLRALNRAGAAGQLKFGLFAQADGESIYRNYYGLPAGALCDFANTDSWDKVWWQRIVKPWTDTIPQSQWYLINGKLPIEFWGLGIGTLYANPQGNVSQMCNYIDNQLFATYGVHACFIMGGVNYDTTLATLPSVVGNNNWFSPPNTSYTMTAYKGAVWGGIAAGFINWRYFEPTDPNYHSPNYVIRRNGVAGTGTNGDTLKAGLNAAIAQNAKLSVIEGWVNVSEWNGLYRSNAAEWDYPNQYINILRSYNDLRTVTLRLEAEAADDYSDTTTGNSGGAFLRSTENLDVRALSGAPAISASSVSGSYAAANAFDGTPGSKWVSVGGAPAWLQYDYGSGNTEVVTGYYLENSEYALAQAIADSPKTWQLQGSNNGSSWTNLDSQTGVSFSARNETKYYSFTNTTAYRYYRLNVTNTGGGGSSPIAIADLRLMGTNSKGGGWAVTDTAAGETIEFRDISFSPGNYKFPVRYSAAAAGKRLRLSVDGVALPDVTLPATGSVNTFDTISLGQKTMIDGLHDLKVTFVDGGVDLDWLFVRKSDPMISLHASTGYVSAELGGNSTVTAGKTAIGGWEKFSANDDNGGTLDHNDTISLQVNDGLFLTAASGGGGALLATQRALGAYEKFTIVKTSGSGAIVNGDSVALRSVNGNYVTAVSATSVNVSATSIGAAQTFTAALSAQ
jgi:hypothetical protein